MARIRYLKPDFFKDEDIAELPHQTRLFFAGLWNYADKAGRLEDRPKRLKVEIFPYEKADTEKMLQLLAKSKPNSQRPFITRYQVDGNNYIQILSWNKHQKPHHTEPDSAIPPIPPLKEKGTISKDKGECQDSLTPQSNSFKTVKTPLFDVKTEFANLYAKYPKKVGRKAALRSFTATVKSKSDIERVSMALDNYLASRRVSKGFVQNASTWFGNWTDWIDNPDPICPKCKGKGFTTSVRGFDNPCDCDAGKEKK